MRGQTFDLPGLVLSAPAAFWAFRPLSYLFLLPMQGRISPYVTFFFQGDANFIFNKTSMCENLNYSVNPTFYCTTEAKQSLCLVTALQLLSGHQHSSEEKVPFLKMFKCVCFYLALNTSHITSKPDTRCHLTFPFDPVNLLGMFCQVHNCFL